MLLELLDQMFERMFRIGDCVGVHVGEDFERGDHPAREGRSHGQPARPADPASDLSR